MLTHDFENLLEVPRAACRSKGAIDILEAIVDFGALESWELADHTITAA
jgi:hypothetical protein